jgi:hypothetical protein
MPIEPSVLCLLPLVLESPTYFWVTASSALQGPFSVCLWTVYSRSVTAYTSNKGRREPRTSSCASDQVLEGSEDSYSPAPSLEHLNKRRRDRERVANMLSFGAEDTPVDAYQATRIFYVTAMRRIYRDLYDSQPATKRQYGHRPTRRVIGAASRLNHLRKAPTGRPAESRVFAGSKSI